MCSVQSKKFEGYGTLAQRAVVLAKDGVLSKEDKDQLIALAAIDNNLDEKEKEIIRGLDDADNLESLQSAGFNPQNFTFNVRTEEVGGINYKKSATPIPGTIVVALGQKFEKEYLNSGNTVESMAAEIFSSRKVSANPELKQSIANLIDTFESTDREALIYLKELVLDRKPPMSNDELKKSIDKLTSMMKTENYDPRIADKKAMIISGLHDIAAPSDISQMHISSCAGTSIQIQLAIRSPARYLDMLDTLAKNQPFLPGTSPDSEPIKPNWTFVDEGKNGNWSSDRTISCMIMQNAIMGYAKGTGVTGGYDSTFEHVTGLSSKQELTAIRNLIGPDLVDYSNDNNTPAQLIDILKAAKPSPNIPVQIALCYDDGGKDAFHAVSVTAIDNNNVTIINPWGREEIIPVYKLNSRIYDVFASESSDDGIIRLSADRVTEEAAKSESYYNYYWTQEDPVSLLLNDPVKSTVALSHMSLDDKVKLIEEIRGHDETLTDKDKLAIIKVLQSVYQGSQGQDIQVKKELEDKINYTVGVGILKLMKEIKIDDPAYYALGEDVVRSQGKTENNQLKIDLAKTIFLPQRPVECVNVIQEK